MRRRETDRLLRSGAVIALALFAMLRPALVYTKTKPQSATLVVLADRSRSMMISDAVGGKSFARSYRCLRQLGRLFLRWPMRCTPPTGPSG